MPYMLFPKYASKYTAPQKNPVSPTYSLKKGGGEIIPLLPRCKDIVNQVPPEIAIEKGSPGTLTYIFCTNYGKQRVVIVREREGKRERVFYEPRPTTPFKWRSAGKEEGGRAPPNPRSTPHNISPPPFVVRATEQHA